MALLHETYSVKSFVLRMSRTQHEREQPILHSAGPALRGMEKPVPSFQQFLRSVPPPPLRELPPIPFFNDTVPMSTRSIPRTSTTDRISTTSSAPSWWENEEEKPLDRRLEPEPEPEPSRDSLIFLQPSTYTVSSPQLARPERPLPPLLEPRTFSPLLDTPLVSPSNGATPDEAPAFEYDLDAESPQIGFWPQPPSTFSNEDGKITSAESPPLIPSITKDFALQAPQTPLPRIPDELRKANEHTMGQTAEKSDLGAEEKKIPGKAIASLGLTIIDKANESKHNPQSSTQVPPRSPEYAHYIPSQHQGPSTQGLSPRRADFREESDVKDERLSKDHHHALLDQYRELARPETALFDDDSWFVPSEIGTGRDIQMAPQPLFAGRRMETQHRRVDSVNTTSPISSQEEVGKDKGKGNHHRRRSSLRDQFKETISSGPLKMVLPSKYPRADYLVSPLSPTKPDTEKAKDTSKEKKNRKGKKAADSLPHTPPLPLTLVASLSSKSSSSRPSLDSNRPRPSMESRHGSPLAYSPQLATEPRQGTPLSTVSQNSSESRPSAPVYKTFPGTSPSPEGRSKRTMFERPRHQEDNIRSREQSPIYHFPSKDTIYPHPMERVSSDLSPPTSSTPSPKPTASTFANPFTLGNLSKLSISAPSVNHLPFMREKTSPSPPTSPDSVTQRFLRQEDGERRWSFSKKTAEQKRESQRAKRRTDLKNSIKFVGQTDPSRLDGYL